MHNVISALRHKLANLVKHILVRILSSTFFQGINSLDVRYILCFGHFKAIETQCDSLKQCIDNIH